MRVIQFIRKSCFFLFVLSFGSWNLASAEQLLKINRGKSKHVVFRTSNTQQILHELNQRGFDIAGVSLKSGIIGVVVDEGKQEWFENHILQLAGTQVLVEEEGMVPLNLRMSDQYAPHIQDYMNPGELEQAMRDLAAQFPERAHLLSIGKSLQGRDLWALRIGAHTIQSRLLRPIPKIAVLFNGLHHAREVMTPEVTLDIARYLLENYERDSKVKSWVDGLDIWVVPMVNPDGSHIVFTREDLWRKNARDWFFGIFGVDLNRNYSYSWGIEPGSSRWSRDETYRGNGALSEPESMAMDLLNKKIRFGYSISYHAYSELVIYPFGNARKKTVEEALFKDLAKTMASKLRKTSEDGATYDFGKAWELLYEVTGCDIDHHYAEYGTFAFTIEVNDWIQGFHPNYKLWRNHTVLNQRPGWQYLLDRALNGPGLVLKIVNPADFPWVDAEIEISEIKRTAQEQVKPFKSNAAGFFYHALLPGTYHVEVRVPRKAPVQRIYHVGQETVTDTIVF